MRPLSPVRNRLFVGNAIVCANAVTCHRSVLLMQLGPDWIMAMAVLVLAWKDPISWRNLWGALVKKNKHVYFSPLVFYLADSCLAQNKIMVLNIHPPQLNKCRFVHQYVVFMQCFLDIMHLYTCRLVDVEGFLMQTDLGKLRTAFVLTFSTCIPAQCRDFKTCPSMYPGTTRGRKNGL